MEYEIAIYATFDLRLPIREVVCERKDFPKVYSRLRKTHKKELANRTYYFEVYKDIDLVEMFRRYFGNEGVVWHKKRFLRLNYEEDIEEEIRKIQAESKQKTR